MLIHRWLSTVFAALLWLAAPAHALTASEAQAIAVGETEERVVALNLAVQTADGRTAAFIQALSDDAVRFAGAKVFIIKDDKGYDPVTGAEVRLPDDAEDVINNNMMRGALETALAALSLSSPDDKVRAERAR